MKQTFHCTPCNLDHEHLSHPGCSTKEQARAAGLTVSQSLPCPKCSQMMSERVVEVYVTEYYRCGSCERTLQVKVGNLKDIPESQPCLLCGQTSWRVYTSANSPSVARSGSDTAPVDIVVGRAAEKRWDNIHARQEKRNDVRKKAGQQGITATGPATFAPITQEQKIRRTKVMETARKTGVGEVNAGSPKF